MANIAKTYTMTNGQPADATQVNKNFDDIIAGVGDISAAGHALIDDADAAAQRVTLGGVVVGPASSTDNAIVRFDGVTGKLVQNSSVFIDDAGNVGIGTTTPKLMLEVEGTNAAESVTATPNGSILISDVSGPSRQVLTMGVVNGDGNHAWIQSRSSSETNKYTLALNPSGGAVTIGGVGVVVTNDARLSDARPASDVSAWAKAASKPSYTAAEVGSRTIATGTAGTSGTVTHGLGGFTFISMTLIGGTNATFSINESSANSFSFTTTGSPALVKWIVVA